MTGRVNALTAYHWICTLAEDNSRVLDAAMALMAGSAWAGGGAQRFADDLAGQRTALQRAWTTALDAAAELVAKTGGGFLVPPVVSSAMASARVSGRMVGVSVPELAAMIGQVSQAGTRLGPTGAELEVVLASVSLPASPGQVVSSVGEWASGAAGGLRTRLAVAERMDRDGMIGPQLAAFGVFASWLPGEAGLGRLLDAATACSEAALVSLMKRQAAATGPDLAIAINTWWQGLILTVQQRLIAADPATVGALDGLPATARDQANRLVFTGEYDRLTAEQRQLTAELARDEKLPQVNGWDVMRLGIAPPPDSISPAKITALQAELAHVNGLLSGLTAIKNALGRPGQGQDGLPPVYLLGFDTSDLGHCIVSYGDPDTARNVVTYVPGVGTTLSGASGDLTRASLLWRQAYQFAPAAGTASIFWLGYTAPQLNASELDPSLSMAAENDANAAAPALDSFAAGLAAAHVPDFGAHTVMLGHSYGSLVVGRAAVRWPGQLADDLAFIGSPGVGVNSARQLGVPAAHVFAGQASHDPVPDLPPTVPLSDVEHDPFVFGPVAVGQLAYGLAASLVTGNHTASHFGTNPATPPFGGVDFSVAPGKPVSFSDPTGAHSGYWDPYSASLRNLAYIVDGKYGQIRLASGSPAPPPALTLPGPGG